MKTKKEEEPKIIIKYEAHTTDICLAALFKTKGHDLIRFEVIEENGKRKIRFTFDKTEELMDLVDQYYSSGKHINKNCEFKKFFNELRDLKSLIYRESI